MGLPIARNLLAAGYQVTGVNRSPARVTELVEAGGSRAESPRGAATAADIIITMLPDAPDVSAVLLGPDGVFAHARPGTVVVEMSTIAPRVARELAGAAEEAGLGFLDAPVSGGQAGAVEGTLSIMVGGQADVLERVRGVLEVLG